MRRVSTFLVVALALMLLADVSLYAVGERRLDVYYSLSVLAYLITAELLLPAKEAVRRRVHLVEAVLVAIFFIIVARRVAEVLGWLP